MKQFKTYLFITLFFMASGVHASLFNIEDDASNDFFKDTVSTLEWRDLTAIGDSFITALDQTLIDDGWGLATGAQFNTLIENAGGIIPTTSVLGDVNNQPRYVLAELISLFTNSSIADFDVDGGAIGGLLFDENTPGEHWVATIEIGGLGDSNAASHFTNAHFIAVTDTLGADPGEGLNFGKFLVRSTLASPIPEPSIIALFALGFLGLGLSRRKAHRT